MEGSGKKKFRKKKNKTQVLNYSFLTANSTSEIKIKNNMFYYFSVQGH